jgi:hypothetical protein
MTLRHFRLLSSLSIINGPPCLGGQWTSSSGKAPLVRGTSQLFSLSCRVPAHPRQPANRWQAHQRRTLLRSPGHGSSKHQIKCYSCRSTAIRYQIDTMGDFGHTYGGGAVNLYAFIVFDGRRYPDKSNSCANHQFTSSRVRFLADSQVGSPDPEYSYSGCTRSLHGCTRLQMKFSATVGLSSRLLSNISSSSSTYTILALDGLADQLSCSLGI